MAKYYGSVGFAKTVESRPGVWTDSIIERKYSGDVIRINRRWQQQQAVNDDFTVNNQISIVADPYAFENLHLIKYVSWYGANWKVSNVEVQYPRLILSIGGVYNGPQARAAQNSGECNKQ